MVQTFFYSLIFALVGTTASGSELLDRNSFQSQSLSVELGSSDGSETKMDLPFTIHEDVTVEVKSGEIIPGLSLSAKVVERGFQTEHNVEPVLYLQVVAQADYSAKVATDIPVSVRVIGKESGIVHYLHNVKVTVEPKLTIRVSLLEDGSVTWSVPEEVSLSTQDQPVVVSFVLVKNERGEPVRIHSQGGPIPHQPRQPVLQEVGDKYEVVVESTEPAKNIYWEHNRQGSQDQRVIWFNSAE